MIFGATAEFVGEDEKYLLLVIIILTPTEYICKSGLRIGKLWRNKTSTENNQTR